MHLYDCRIVGRCFSKKLFQNIAFPGFFYKIRGFGGFFASVHQACVKKYPRLPSRVCVGKNMQNSTQFNVIFPWFSRIFFVSLYH